MPRFTVTLEGLTASELEELVAVVERDLGGRTLEVLTIAVAP